MVRIISVICALICAAILVGNFAPGEGAQPIPEPSPTPRIGDVARKDGSMEDLPLREDKSVYADDDDDSVIVAYLTLRLGNEAEQTNHTWEEVNTYDTYYYRDLGIPRYKCEAILQIGDESGPLPGCFGYGETVPNATVQIRGQTSSRNDQKNYKIRVKDGKGNWRDDMQTLAINKYQKDPVRFRNKLVFDLFKDVPQLTSTRTQFVHLYVKDETAGGGDGEFEDYGLYTSNELLNRRWLKNHGLDKNGYLYKVVSFEWQEYEPVMLSMYDEDFDQDEFDLYLQAKGNENPEKLQDVIAAVNDYTVPITETVDRYFDIENISYWIAAQILVGNYDTGARNLYLYSPLNTEKWYFLSWDEDDTFSRTYYGMRNYSEGGSWQRGISQFVGIVLFNRMFREEPYREALKAAVEDLRANYISRAEVERRVQMYSAIVREYLAIPPDSEFRETTEEVYEYLVSQMASEVEMNYQYFLESLEKPFPFFVGVPQPNEDGSVEIA